MNPYQFIPNLAELIPDIPPDSIISRTLHESDGVRTVLFGFAPGQELSEHTASVPAVLWFVQGEADLTLGGDSMQAHAGTWVQMPPKMPHSVHAKTTVIMLLLMIRSTTGGNMP
ncbi:MAG: cupin domain-containing protein [Chloroflexi bacterium]|nr:cupin domain-containing protein [Chloroflexota bacterium]